MWQTFFHIHLPIWPHDIAVYGYGVMLVIGFITAMYVAQFLARKSKLDPELFANVAIIALVSGVIGARLSHVLENISEYTLHDLSFWDNFWNAVNIRQGGLTYYGGFLLAFPACIAYGLWKKIPIRLGMDILAPCIVIGLGFGRIGCFLNGCCYGADTNVSWAVQFPYGSDAYITQFTYNQLHRAIPRELVRPESVLDQYMEQNHLDSIKEPLPEDFGPIRQSYLLQRDELVKEWNKTVYDRKGNAVGTIGDLVKQQKANPVHPAEIYSSIVAFAIAAFLLAYFTLPHIPGHIFAALMMIEGVFRYVLEILRVEPAVVGHGTRYLTFIPPQSYSMVVSFLLVIGGVILWFVFARMAGDKGSQAVQQPALA